MSTLTAEVQTFFSDPQARRDPADFYRRLVTEEPVTPLGRMWVVAGYDELMAVATHPATSSDPSVLGTAIPLSPNPVLSAALSRMLPLRDGADHRRLKGLAIRTFSSRGIAQARTLVSETVDALVDANAGQGSFDVVADLAVPLPVALTCALLAIPVEDRGRVLEWAVVLSGQMLGFGVEQPPDTDRKIDDLLDYINRLCADREHQPGPDLLSRLALATRDGQLTHDELVAFVLMLFVNGLETLTAGLSAAVWQVLQAPELLDHIRDHPGDAEAVFDECVRLGSPVRASTRVLLDDIDVGGRRLRRGAAAILLFAAANRDPRRFVDPDRLDPRRSERRHLGFGFGPHLCLGAPLSLAAGATLLDRLARRCRDLRTPLTADTAQWEPSLAFTGLRALPVTFAAAVPVDA
ncbi:cytochrome P450 [Frankia sp. Cr1]|uniref:cytochrome P450 n=1 Tax=Frankia sp. Cr1 TaxID=3073931 RepID=UPI002AD39A53|nr:cytochrome P450 [Frankia sp. Cr1]